MAITKSEALKRVTVISVQQFADEAMENVPRTALDLSVDAHRELLRGWIARVLHHAVRDSATMYAEVAEKAIREASELTINPRYYAEQKEYRARRKQQRNERIKEQNERLKEQNAQPQTASHVVARKPKARK